MHNRFVVPGLCAAALIYACGPWMHSQSAPVAEAAPLAAAGGLPAARHVTPATDHAPATVLTTFDVRRDGHALALSLHVINNTSHVVELRFPNARTHDFTVVDAHGTPVWRWSRGRIFTQTMQTRTIASHDTTTLSNDWDARNAHGTYTVIATLATAGAPVVRRVTLTLP